MLFTACSKTKHRQNFRLFLLLITFLSLLSVSACTENRQTALAASFCSVTDENIDHCRYSLANLDEDSFVYIRSSNPYMPFETPVTLYLKLPENVAIVASEIVGESMYMGRIPVFWSQPEGSDYQQADVYLGACTDPQMVWALRIQFTHSEVNPPSESDRIWLHLTFQSHR